MQIYSRQGQRADVPVVRQYDVVYCLSSYVIHPGRIKQIHAHYTGNNILKQTSNNSVILLKVFFVYE